MKIPTILIIPTIPALITVALAQWLGGDSLDVAQIGDRVHAGGDGTGCMEGVGGGA